MQNRFEFFVLSLFIGFFRLFGLSNANITSSLLGPFLYWCLPLRKKVIRKNLRTAFPEKSDTEIEKLVKANYVSLITNLHEISCIKGTPKEVLKTRIAPRNVDIINDELDKGQGLLLLTAHFGNWELGGLALSAYTHKELFALAKPQRNTLVNNWLNSIREVYGNKVVPSGIGVREIFKIIKSGCPIIMVGDQRGPSDGLRVKFFGQDTAVYIGSAAIALKTNTPVYFFLSRRMPDGTYEMVFEKIDYSGFEGSNEDKIRQINQSYMSKLEAALRKNPEQWFWMHNIWKY